MAKIETALRYAFYAVAVITTLFVGSAAVVWAFVIDSSDYLAPISVTRSPDGVITFERETPHGRVRAKVVEEMTRLTDSGAHDICDGTQGPFPYSSAESSKITYTDEEWFLPGCDFSEPGRYLQDIWWSVLLFDLIPLRPVSGELRFTVEEPMQ